MRRAKLIEVAMPLAAISEEASLRKRKAPGGYPTLIHKWWAQRPIAACSAVLFGQLVDDPGSVPAEFPTDDAQRKERDRLFALIEELVKWENSGDEAVLHAARVEVVRSFWRELTDEQKKAHPESLRQAFAAAPAFAAVKAKAGDVLQFLQTQVPPVHDPFCGGGSIPLEAQRLGVRAIGTDLNPIPVLITKALIDIPPRFRNFPPVNPEARREENLQGVKAGGQVVKPKRGSRAVRQAWKGAAGLAADVRYYGEWMREEAHKRIGHLYPSVKVTTELAKGRDDLKPYIGRELSAIAWLWARTVKCPNPACGKRTPMVASFDLSTKAGREACAVPNVVAGTVKFAIERRKSDVPGTKDRYASRCLHCSTDAITNAQLREQYIWQVGCESYRAEPPAFNSIDPLTGELNTRRSIPGQNPEDSFFNEHQGKANICHPFNRRAYGTIHGEWTLANWERLASDPKYGLSTHLHQMLLKIQNRILREDYPGPREPRPKIEEQAP